ncbi:MULTISPECIES: hypothetical protein [unclassified Marinobacter]|jgi:hypothetical protein|uniref:hypothetical protein n=1 Tax=unclassified Marinobacter TaxID=83889 RepID=UPI002010BF08|nr:MULTISPECIES: hypothetical protein [unclassified Marinobacter]UQG66694.1 hypothetical protein MIH17_09760 [Marinobacter sp. M2C]UQG70974.1 hypothetical protein MIH19_09755 [Marinobacter sp. M1C]
MYTTDCRAYLRHDKTATTRQVRLSAYHWSLIERTQKELAARLGVRRVSRPVALLHILDEAHNQQKDNNE